MAVVDVDTFTRANQSGFGTASGGSTWSEVLGNLTASIASNEGSVTGSTTASVFLLGTKTQADQEATLRFSMSSTSQLASIMLRSDSGGLNGYTLRINSGTFAIHKMVSGAATSLGSTSFTLVASTFYWFRFRIVGSKLFGKIWQDGTAEPVAWMLTATDSTYTAAGQFGLRLALATTSANIQVDHFTVTDAVNSLGASLQDKFLVRASLAVSSRARFISRAVLVAINQATFKIKGVLFLPSHATRVLQQLLNAAPMVKALLGATTAVKPQLAATNTRVPQVPTPNTTITSTVTVTDQNGNLVSNLSVCSATVNFPDFTTQSFSLSSGVTNLGGGQYQIKYTTKGVGPVREVWSVTAADTVTVASFQFVSETGY